MTIAFDIEYRDFEAFQLYYAAHERTFRRLRMVMFLFVPLLLIAPSLFRHAEWQSMLPAFIISVAWIVLFNYVFRWSLRRSAKRMYNNPENARLLARRSMTFGQDGIEVKSESADVKFSWDDIAKVGETDEYFFIFTGSNQGYIVPKRHFPEGGSEEIRELFIANDKLT